MKLSEYEAKTILTAHEIPIPQGRLATSASQAREIASELKLPCAIKAQVQVAGRGKAGGIRFAKTANECERVTSEILNMEIKGLKVDSVLLEEKLEVKNELYFGITIDRLQRRYVAIASKAGGIDIEEVSTKTPGKIIKMPVDPILGFRTYNAREIARKLGYSGKQMLELAFVFKKLHEVAMKYDAELIELNPLVETCSEGFVAADARLIIDDSSLYRHPEYEEKLLSEEETELTSTEVVAKKADLAYVQLEGNIGIMGNGAGLVMATLDAVQIAGGKPANFLDVGGGASEDQIIAALNILLTDPKAAVVFINILGGITRCDTVARGILECVRTKKKAGTTKPLVIRLVGTNEEEGRKILSDAGVPVLESMEEAARKAVEISQEK